MTATIAMTITTIIAIISKTSALRCLHFAPETGIRQKGRQDLQTVLLSGLTPITEQRMQTIIGIKMATGVLLGFMAYGGYVYCLGSPQDNMEAQMVAFRTRTIFIVARSKA